MAKLKSVAPDPKPVERLLPETIKASAADVVIAYRTVFGSQEGAIVLADLMRFFAWNMQSMWSEKLPPEHIHIREGGRAVLVHIGRRMETDPASVEATDKTEL